MNFKSKGLFVSIIILIGLLLVCHISNFLYPKNSRYDKNINSFSNLALSIPDTPLATEYNQLIYHRQNDPTVCKNVNEAEIPCSVKSVCDAGSRITVPITTPYELSESEWAVVYKSLYESAGREVLLRELHLSNPKTTNTETTMPNTNTATTIANKK